MTDSKKRSIYRSFIPKEEITIDLLQYVTNEIGNNVNFYSFLAEGILGLVFRDVYNYRLAKGVIDVSQTLSDSHTGVDACMYNLDDQIIVLGEAKFYENLKEGMNKIIYDFTGHSIRNKIESLQATAESCEETFQIILKNLSLNNYIELSISDFMNQKIIFAGFVLHSENDVSKYGNPDFYDRFIISPELINANVCDSIKSNVSGDYEIVLIHLPVNSKKELIVKMIEKSKLKLRSL